MRRDRAEQELTRELAAHLALIEDDLVRRGMTRDEAARAARQALGGTDQIRERQRDARSIGWLEDLRHDLGHSLRALRRAPAFTAATVGTLALGIGATTAIFSVVYALLVKPLPYAADAGDLVRLVSYTPAPPGSVAPPRRGDVGFTAEEARVLGSSLRTVTGVSMAGYTIMSLRGVEGAGHVTVGMVTPVAFDVLGVTPVLGRALSSGSASETEVLLSHRAWQRYFGGAANVLGSTVTFDTVLGRRTGRTLTVVGVMPAAFTFPSQETAFWTTPPVPVTGPVTFRGRLLARLTSGTTLAAALAEIGPVVRVLRQHGTDVRYELVRESDELIGPVRPAVLLLTATVGVLLLIACLNVANLLLARTLSRRRELSVRAAVGASRSRLARQALTESAVLGLAGGIGGVIVALGVLDAFRSLAATLPRIDLASSGPGWGGASFPRIEEVAIDGTVLTFALGIALATGLATGLVSALRASQADVFGAFRATGATTSRGGRSGAAARRALVVAQVACAMTLLVGAVLLGRSLQQLLATNTGYGTDGVLTFQIGLPASTYPDDRLLTFADTVIERLRGLPGVDVAAYANQIPMVQLRDTGGGLWTTPDAARAFAPDAADARLVSRDYLAALGVRIVNGRGFEPRDAAGQPRVVLVNEALARRQFPERDPVGLQVFVGRDTAPWTIVGVVNDVRQFGLDKAPEPQFFADLRQWQRGLPLFPAGAYYVLKGRGAQASLAPELSRVVRALEPEGVVFNVTPMATIVASSMARPRLYASVVGAFAVLGALLASVGLYGVLSFLVHERTGEIGVRLALGATRNDILRMVMGEAGRLVIAGLVVGTAGALALARMADALLYGVTGTDPRPFAVAAVLFLAVSALAIVVPARRAMRSDPLVAIRCE